MRIKIFLASSKELEEERLIFADLVGHLNKALEGQDIIISLVKWEYVDASMGPEHKQEEYNEQLRDCDLCIVLYWTSFGKWTKMELDTAYEEKCAGRNPKRLYVYFKDGEEISEELQKFRDGFPENYGHFFSDYKNIDTLKAHFLLQFMDYLSNSIKDSGVIEIHNSKVIINGKPYVELANVPIIGNNEKYKLLQKTIEDKCMLLSLIDQSHPKYFDYRKELEDARTELQKIEESIWDTALLTTKLSNEKNSKNLQRAIDLLNQGDNKGAQALLLSEDDEKDIAHNLKLIQIGEEGKNGIKDIINKKRLLIKTYENEMSEGWIDKVISLRKEITDISKEAFGKESLEYATALDALGHTYYIHDQNELAEETYSKAFVIFETDRLNKTPEYATLLIHVGDLYMHKDMFLRAEPYYLDALELTKEQFGDSSIQYALPLYKMGGFYRTFMMYDKAKEYQEKTLDIAKESKGDNVWLHAQALRELALCYARVCKEYNRGKYTSFSGNKKDLYQKACSFINEAISLIEKSWGQRNSTYVSLQINLSYIQNICDHKEEAEKILLQTLELSKDINDYHESYDKVLYAIGQFYLFEPEKAEALGFDYSTAKGIPIVVSGDLGKAIKGNYERKQSIADRLAPKIAELYLKKFPRDKYYAVTLYASDWTDNTGTEYFRLNDDEIEVLRNWKNNPVIDDYEYDLHEYLEEKGHTELIDKIVENNSYFGMGLDSLVDCDMEHSLKFSDFSMQIQNKDGSFRNRSIVSLAINDEEYLELLSELIKRSNELSINMLVFMKPEIGKHLMRGLVGEHRTEPFVCDMYELKNAAKSILDPFTDVLQLFESEDEELRKFVIEHQIVDNENDEIYKEDRENNTFHIIATIIGKELRLMQEGVINGDIWHDCDIFIISAQEMMDKFGIEKAGQLIPYLKEHYGTRDAISQLRDIFKEKETAN